jgi:hypothetical protein
LTPDEQEAESLKYSNRVAIILKLRSGAWALFNNQRKLLLTTFSMETLILNLATIEETISLPPRNPKSFDTTLAGIDLDSLLDEI